MQQLSGAVVLARHDSSNSNSLQIAANTPNTQCRETDEKKENDTKTRKFTIKG